MTYLQTKADTLADESAVAQSLADDKRVIIDLSEPLAWLIRDFIGFQVLPTLLPGAPQNKPSFQKDLERLNASLGYRSYKNEPSVHRWSERMARCFKSNVKGMA